jgi:hypothetical protein
LLSCSPRIDVSGTLISGAAGFSCALQRTLFLGALQAMRSISFRETFT